MKDIAASRIDNGPGSRLQAALISELNLDLPNPRQPLYSDDDLLGSFDPSLLQHHQALGTSRGTQMQHAQLEEENQKRVRIARLRYPFAMIGGLALVVPVLVMVVGTTPVKPLVVASVSIFVVAFGIAMFSTATPENALAATAAYAAVLVVFISNTSI